MSLINDALRKAQKQRTGELPPLASMPAIGGESAVRIAKRAKPAGFNTLLLRLGIGGAVLAVVIVGGTILVARKAPSRPPAVAPEVAASQPAEPAVKPAAPAPAPTAFVVPIVSAPAPVAPPKTEAPVAKSATPKPETAPTVVATTPPPAPAKAEPVKPAGPPAKLEPRAINYIESLRVAGIRASATDSKVLMNDRVYRLGNIIEHELGLKLTGITANSLTFEDERGGSYTRTF